MKARAIVPQKSLALAKGRLSAILPSQGRAALSLQLLRAVCAVLRSVGGVEDLAVMSPDPRVRTEAAAWGVRSIADPGPELNTALAAVFATFASPSHAILIVAGDLPFLRAADVAALLSADGTRVLNLAPSKEGTGTNAILIPPGVVFRPAFGEGSLATHRTRARAMGLRVVEVVRPGLAFDLDSPADFALFGAAAWAGFDQLALTGLQT